MNSRNKNFGNPGHWAIALLVSIFANFLLLSLINLSDEEALIKNPTLKATKKVKFKSWVKTVSKQQKKKKKTPVKPEERKAKERLQVVENTPSLLKEKAPEDTRLASLYERRVKKQSLAKNRELTSKKHASKKSEKKKQPQKAEIKPRPVKPKKNQSQASKGNKLKTKLSGKGLKLDFRLKEGLEIFENETNKKGLRPDREALLSMIEKPVLEKIESDGIPFADYVENIEEGEETLLNTKEYRFAGYFSRIKRKVAPEWFRRLKYETKRRDPTRKIYLNKQRITVLNIFLDTEGHFLKADILESSGVRFIDKIAIKSFIATSPFLNPPSALRDNNGEISLKFAFIIQVDAPPIYEIFR